MTYHRKRLVEQVAAPSVEPVNLAEVKKFLRIEHSDEDTLLNSFIAAARRAAEEYMSRSLMLQQWKLSYDGYPPQTVCLPYGPVNSVVSVNIVQVDDSSAVLAPESYYLTPARDMVVFEVIPCGHRVEITYEAGAALQSDIPPSIQQGLISHVAALYEYRERAVMPESTKALYAPYREVRI
jgi:uncharacterized phiE125 gp8 family phage protein